MLKEGVVEVKEDLTLQVAELARLELSEEEVRTFTAQLSNILKYMETLQEVDVRGVEPLLHPLELETPFREDEVHVFPVDSEGNSKVLESAPEILYSGFKVPPIL